MEDIVRDIIPCLLALTSPILIAKIFFLELSSNQIKNPFNHKTFHTLTCWQTDLPFFLFFFFCLFQMHDVEGN